MKRYCVVVAGGTGNRMNSAVPKQFLLLNGKPIVVHTLERLLEFDPQLNLILVLPEKEFNTWKKIRDDFSFTHSVQVIAGGNTRFQSVSNGLSLVPENCSVGVHDAARPLLTKELLERCFLGAEKNGNAIPVMPLNDSLREISETGNRQVDRSAFVSVQTPQCFQSTILKRAFKQEESTSFTDDATVLEAFGESIHLVEGEKWNLKITHPEDLLIAENTLQNKPEINRTKKA
ncbi:MAG: 2-C-methyl-D-erythritol 4-phosphate cytidylyltransferase [Bacteroidetes bacterium]|nr:2-C-methyl-D-erythritol 4-phosphate cytidylyltransferase [Bacteroidota bacterium]